jgi:FtsP/CotA-like multicopper oxidase with cupredoxin domain
MSLIILIIVILNGGISASCFSMDPQIFSIEQLTNDYGCNTPCDQGNVVYEIEASIQRNQINGDLTNYFCKGCQSSKPFANVDKVFATLRSFQTNMNTTTSKKLSPFCEMMNGYNGTDGLLGPCLQAKPGDVISIKLINNFGPNAMQILQSVIPSKQDWWQAAGKPKGTNPSEMHNEADTVENNPGWDEDGQVWDLTNLHFHGLQVKPHLFYPLGTSEPTAPWIQVEPTNANGKQCFCYQLGISADQSPGTFLYHIHRHGSSAMQLWSGMLGLIQIGGSDYKPSLDWELPNRFHVTRDIPLAIWSPSLRYQNTAANYFENPAKNNDGSTQPKLDRSTNDAEMELNSWNNNEMVSVSPVLLNNDYQPTIQMIQGEIARFRVVCIFVTMFCGFAIVPDTPGLDPLDPDNQIDLYAIASDGIAYSTPKLRKRMILTSAQREDILVRFDKPGRYLIRSDGVYAFTAPMSNPDVILAFVEVSETSSTTTTTRNKKKQGKHLKTSIPQNISEWIFIQTPPRTPLIPLNGKLMIQRTYSFQGFTPDPLIMPNQLLEINHDSFRFNIINTNVYTDALEEWTLVTPQSVHTYHIHINPFIVKNIQSDKVVNEFADPNTRMALMQDQIGLWRDTITIPPRGNVTIWIKFSAKDPLENKPYIGKTVYHCHLFDDTDTGMMQNINILPAPSTHAPTTKK